MMDGVARKDIAFLTAVAGEDFVAQVDHFGSDRPARMTTHIHHQLFPVRNHRPGNKDAAARRSGIERAETVEPQLGQTQRILDFADIRSFGHVQSLAAAGDPPVVVVAGTTVVHVKFFRKIRFYMEKAELYPLTIA